LSQLKYYLPTNDVFEYVIEVDEASVLLQQECKAIFEHMLPSKGIQHSAIALSLYVSSKLGGSNISKDFQLEIVQLQHEIKSVVIPLTKLKTGRLTERSILFKYLADSLNIPTKLTLFTNQNHPKCHHHLISTVIMDSQDIYVDLMCASGSIYRYPSIDLNTYLDKVCQRQNNSTNKNILLLQKSEIVLTISIKPDVTRLKCVSANVT
jgi:hypothetical protein